MRLVVDLAGDTGDIGANPVASNRSERNSIKWVILNEKRKHLPILKLRSGERTLILPAPLCSCVSVATSHMSTQHETTASFQENQRLSSQ